MIGNGLQQWLPKASAAGITSLFDAGIVMVPDTDGFGLYRNLEAAGKLPVRVVGSYYFNNPDVDPIPIITSLRKTFDRGLVRVPILKISADGGDFQRTAAMLAPYADDPQSTGATNYARDDQTCHRGSGSARHRRSHPRVRRSHDPHVSRCDRKRYCRESGA